MTTPRFGLVEWTEGTTQPQTIFNALQHTVDVFLAGGVKSRTTDAQPGSPAEGDCYIITATPSGAAWSGFTQNYIAAFYDGAWTQYAPPGRYATYVDDEGVMILWDGAVYNVTSVADPLQESDIDTLAKLNAIVADATIASQAYVDAAIIGLLDLQGGYDAATNTPDLDTSPSGILKGYYYVVTAAGTFFTEDLEVGDTLLSLIDNPTVLADWSINNKNITGSGGGGGLTASVKSANYTITGNEDVGTDSTGGVFTITLKASPVAGDTCIIRDVKSYCGTNPVAIDRNGSTINGLAEDESLNVDNGVYMFTCATSGDWVFTPITVGGLNQTQVDARVVVVTSGIKTKELRPYDLTSIATETTRAQIASRHDVLQFAASGYNWATFPWDIPKSWDGGNVRFRMLWSPSTTNTGNINFALYGTAINNGSLVGSYTMSNTGPSITEAAAGVADAFKWSAWSDWAALDAPLVDNLYMFRLQGNADSGTYTFTGVVNLYLLQIQYQTNAPTDD